MIIEGIKHVSFSGGGSKGIFYIGILKTLKEYGTLDKIESWTGTSIGSVFALLGYLQIPWQDILNNIINYNLENLFDLDINNFLETQGLIKGSAIEQLLINTCNNKLLPHMTFNDLFNQTNKTLYICGYNVDKSKSHLFSHKTTPNLPVIDAIKASCSVPILFPPKLILNNYYYDGSTLELLPITHLPSLGTIGWELEEVSKNNQNDIFHSLKFLKLLVGIRENLVNNKDTSQYIIYKIHTQQNFLNIFMDRNDIFNLFMKGYEFSKKQLYDDFLALPPPST